MTNNEMIIILNEFSDPDSKIEIPEDKAREAVLMALNFILDTMMKTDGCCGCAHFDCEDWEPPCNKCRRIKMDYWRGKA